MQHTESCSPWLTSVVLSAHFGGSWQLLHDGDNRVFADQFRVAKVAKHPDGAARLTNGVVAALAADAAGVPVVVPLLDHVVVTETGPVSLWPLVEHRSPTVISFDDGVLLGSALARLSLLECVPVSWDPFGRVAYRLAVTKAPTVLVERARRLVSVFGDCTFPPEGCAVFAHGDASGANTLFTETAAFLIDFDSAGPRPPGWDLACLWATLVNGAGNDEAFAGVLAGWSAVAPVPSVDEHLVALKAFMATTSLFTLAPEPLRLERISVRLTALERWAAGGTLDRFPSAR